MTSVQADVIKPLICARGTKDFRSRSFRPNRPVLASHLNQCSGTSLRLLSTAFKWQQFEPVMKQKKHQMVPRALFGSGGKSGDVFADLAPGSSPEKQSAEYMLREQMRTKKYYVEGGSGGKPPGRGGGGGGDGRNGDSGGRWRGPAWNLYELLQVALATLGFLFLYVLLISGEEMILLAKDYIQYISEGSKSIRLKRAVYKWRRFFKKMTENEEGDPYLSEKETINTRTRTALRSAHISWYHVTRIPSRNQNTTKTSEQWLHLYKKHIEHQTEGYFRKKEK